MLFQFEVLKILFTGPNLITIKLYKTSKFKVFEMIPKHLGVKTQKQRDFNLMFFSQGF